MTLLRRIALGFPLAWTHRRGFSFDAIGKPGQARYFIEWDPGTGVYGEDFSVAPRDANGVLLSGPAKHYHAIRIAQFALHRYGLWKTTGDPSAMADFLAQAAYLRDNQHGGDVEGLYRFDFPWSKYGAKSGWTSAMAQGEAISVLLRADFAEPQRGYRDAAVRASNPFRYAIEDGGVVWRGGEDVFFEEIAHPSAPHVLNGCIFALWGLWELSRCAPETGHESLISSCVDTLRRWIPRFDTGWWTLYSLMRTAAGRSHVATFKYHEFHIAQMRVLARMFDDDVFAATAERWGEYVQRRECRFAVLRDTAQSLPERFLRRDTVAGGAHT